MNSLNIVQKIIIWAIPVIFAITIHEVAHGWVANKLGDPTARMLGRLTLNPIRHIDLFGTIIIPAVLLMLPGVNFVFGWAKPVPVNYNNLHNPKRDMALVAIAGPIANLVMAFIWAGVAKLGLYFNPTLYSPISLLVYMGVAGIIINLVLMVLNIIPLPPLDGSRVVSSLLSNRISWYYNRLEPYGFFILIILLASGMLSRIMSPMLTSVLLVVMKLFNLPMNLFMS